MTETESCACMSKPLERTRRREREKESFSLNRFEVKKRHAWNILLPIINDLFNEIITSNDILAIHLDLFDYDYSIRKKERTWISSFTFSPYDSWWLERDEEIDRCYIIRERERDLFGGIFLITREPFPVIEQHWWRRSLCIWVAIRQQFIDLFAFTLDILIARIFFFFLLLSF